jgi:predicted nucleotidyltransferase
MPTDDQGRLVIGPDDILINQIPEVGDETERHILAEVVARLAVAYHPLTIYLFGSRARGDYRRTSDYDLLVVVPDDAPAQLQGSRKAYECLRGIGKAVDVLVCTRDYFSSREHVRTSIPARVIREGKVVYAV